MNDKLFQLDIISLHNVNIQVVCFSLGRNADFSQVLAQLVFAYI